MLKRTGARTQPCFTPLLIAKASVTFPEDLASHAHMEKLDYLHKLRWASCSFKDCPKSFPADRIEGFGQINEHRVEWHIWLDILLLKLTHEKNHVHCASARPEAALCLRKILIRNGNEPVKDDLDQGGTV